MSAAEPRRGRHLAPGRGRLSALPRTLPRRGSRWSRPLAALVAAVSVVAVLLTGGHRLDVAPGASPTAATTVGPTSAAGGRTTGAVTTTPTTITTTTLPAGRAAPAGTGSDAVPGPAGVLVGTAEKSGAGTPAVSPVGLTIPAIDLVDVAVDALGVRPDGTLDVPEDPDRTGWLTAGARPGARGPAVLAGHVDSADGSAVFTRLGELRVGDDVTVRLEDGSDVTYRVTGSERYAKTQFPTDRVYGPAPAPVLRLITCGGSFDRAAGSYVDNVVVYATMVA